MLNEFESCSSRLFRTKSTHYPCSACCRKRVGWIRCKCNQNLERNESARRVSMARPSYGQDTVVYKDRSVDTSRAIFVARSRMC